MILKTQVKNKSKNIKEKYREVLESEKRFRPEDSTYNLVNGIFLVVKSCKILCKIGKSEQFEIKM